MLEVIISALDVGANRIAAGPVYFKIFVIIDEGDIVIRCELAAADAVRDRYVFISQNCTGIAGVDIVSVDVGVADQQLVIQSVEVDIRDVTCSNKGPDNRGAERRTATQQVY